MGLRRIPAPSLKAEGVRRILWLMAPRTAGLAVSQINMVVLLALASALSVGSIAVFNLANNLQSFPVGIFGISFAVAAFPNLARSAGAKRDEEFRSVLGSAARKVLFLIIPSTVIFFLLRAQIVRLVLGAGVFDWNDTIRTADVMGIFTVSMTFQALVPLLARAFYALQDTWTPLIAGVISEGFNLLLAMLLRGPFGISGLAIAFSAAALLNLIMLWWMLHYRKRALGASDIALSFGKTFAASLALFGFGWIARQAVGTLFPLETFWQVALQVVATLAVGGGAFVVVAVLLKSEEFHEFHASAIRRFWKKGGVMPGADEAQIK
jgi:putative peptidoglycan lipid II flippase